MTLTLLIAAKAKTVYSNCGPAVTSYVLSPVVSLKSLRERLWVVVIDFLRHGIGVSLSAGSDTALGLCCSPCY